LATTEAFVGAERLMTADTVENATPAPGDLPDGGREVRSLTADREFPNIETLRH
jgi:hypothetical protein